MSDSQAKRTMPRVLISLLITLIIGGVWFYVSLPAINLHNTGFYSFVLVLLLVYILVFMIALGVDTGSQGIHLRDYLSFAKNQCKVVVILVLIGLFAGGLIFNWFDEKFGNIYMSWLVHMFANFATNTIGFILFNG